MIFVTIHEAFEGQIITAKKDYDTMSAKVDEIQGIVHERSYDRLMYLAGIIPDMKINEVEFGSAVHGRKFSVDELARLRAGLKGRGFWEPLA